LNILFITPRLPFPPVKGDRLRSLYFIKELSRRHAVHLLSFIESTEEKESIPFLKKYCESVDIVLSPPWRSTMNMLLPNILAKEPFQVAYYRSQRMKKFIKYLVGENRYDIVHITLIRMANYIECINELPVVVDHIDCLSLNMERRYKTENGLLKNTLFKRERGVMKKFEFMHREIPSIVTSEKDKEALNGYTKIKVVSNGVDYEKFNYRYEKDIEKDIDLLFVGNMSYFPNAQAVEFFFDIIYPILKQYKENFKVYVVGPNPNRKIRSLSDNNKIFVTGLVDEVVEYYHRAKVFIAPLQSGSGIQNKILEAMACGVSVVTTSVGNSGIQAKDGEHIYLADDPKSFTNKVDSLLENNDERKRLAKNARAFVEDNFSWEAKSRELESFYQMIVQDNRVPTS
jgi:sugar transferase (PEP-CTERM/EpsH1 system associated)